MPFVDPSFPTSILAVNKFAEVKSKAKKKKEVSARSRCVRSRFYDTHAHGTGEKKS